MKSYRRNPSKNELRARSAKYIAWKNKQPGIKAVRMCMGATAAAIASAQIRAFASAGIMSVPDKHLKIANTVLDFVGAVKKASQYKPKGPK